MFQTTNQILYIYIYTLYLLHLFPNKTSEQQISKENQLFTTHCVQNLHALAPSLPHGPIAGASHWYFKGILKKSSLAAWYHITQQERKSFSTTPVIPQLSRVGPISLILIDTIHLSRGDPPEDAKGNTWRPTQINIDPHNPTVGDGAVFCSLQLALCLWFGVDCNSPLNPWTSGSWQRFSFRSTWCCFPLPYVKVSSKEQPPTILPFLKRVENLSRVKAAVTTTIEFLDSEIHWVMKFLPPQWYPNCKNARIWVQFLLNIQGARAGWGSSCLLDLCISSHSNKRVQLQGYRI